MEYTPNYHLSKPDSNDRINPNSRNGYNDNFDTLDTTLKSVSDKANANEGDITDIQGDIADINAKTGDDIPFESGSADSISDKIAILYNLVVPVGSVLCFANNTNPNDIYQGTTWQKIEGKFLLGSSSDYALGSTGGSADAVVVSHAHDRICYVGNDGWTLGDSIGYGGTQTDAHSVRIANGTSVNSQAISHFRTSATGQSGTGKNMPPYTVVNYWERIA